MPKEIELFTCPNPECHEKIEDLIVVRDASTTPMERYYACPHCLTKLDVIFADFLKQEEKKRKEAPPVKPPEMEEKILKREESPNGCPHHFGYLASHVEDSSIPRKCLACQKVLDCVLKASDS